MTVNQAQVDHIIATASADDPEVKLQKLQDEVDLIKTSVKRLLIDIRERLNEVDNPFAASSRNQESGKPAAQGYARKPAPGETEESRAGDNKSNIGEAAQCQKQGIGAESEVIGQIREKGDSTARSDLARILELFTQKAITSGAPENKPEITGRSKLRTVHHLFGWTSKMVGKYGHDRLELMLQSFRAMGYITEQECDQIREMSRLMPASLGEVHEIGPYEFVFELYSLNRILDPADTSLDRDMLEVVMEQKKGMVSKESQKSKESAAGSEYIELPDRV